MTALSIEFVSVFGLSPVDLAHLTADLECDHFTTVLQPSGDSLLGYPRFSLRDNLTLRQELKAVMADRGVSLSLGEGIAIMANLDVREAYPRHLEVMQELGVPRINVVSLDPDLGRTFDQLAHLSELAADYDIETLVEFVPIFPISDLSLAMEAVRHVARPDCKIMFDTMHFFRSGSQIVDLEAVDPALIGYIQLCDVPAIAVNPDYLDEAVNQRLAPGDGDLPLADILQVLPRGRVVGLEVPLRGEALAGIGHRKRMNRVVEAARTILPT